MSNDIVLREKHLARAIEFDDLGRLILADGIAFGPLLAAICPVGLQEGDVLVWYSLNADWKNKAIQEFSQGPFSHVGIYVGDGNSVDAGPDGVSCMPTTTSWLISPMDGCSASLA
jgi:cell wall-associated NlpC family hydrolase